MRITLTDVLTIASVVCGVGIVSVPLLSAHATEAARGQALDRLRQTSVAFLLYAEDANDTLPRADGCQSFSSLNPSHHRPDLNDRPWEGCLGPFYNRLNHYVWQKWVAGYASHPSVFENPLRVRDEVAFDRDGTLLNGFTLNVALMGTIKVDVMTGQSDPKDRRRSWIDGHPSALAEPDRAMLILDVATFLPFVPMLHNARRPDARETTVYPLAVREYWTYLLRAGTLDDCLRQARPLKPDLRKAVDGRINVAMLNGGARTVTVEEFLALTPSKSDWGIRQGAPDAGWEAGNDCNGLQPEPLADFSAPNLRRNLDAPFWGLRK